MSYDRSMNSSPIIKITRLFALPLLYISATSILAAHLLNTLRLTNQPVKISAILGAITGLYIVWFIAEGHKKLKEL